MNDTMKWKQEADNIQKGIDKKIDELKHLLYLKMQTTCMAEGGGIKVVAKAVADLYDYNVQTTVEKKKVVPVTTVPTV